MEATQDLVAVLIGAIGAIIVAAIAAIPPLMSAWRQLQEAGQQVRDVHESTVNDHGTDLRRDVDLLKSGMVRMGNSLDRIERSVRSLADADKRLAEHDARHQSESRKAWNTLAQTLESHDIAVIPWPNSEEDK